MEFLTSLLLDVPFPIRTCGGGVVPMALPEALADPAAQGISSGHPYVDAVANNFLICAIQTLMMPTDAGAWADRLYAPPSASDVRG